jgi:hypothetical protein
MVVSTRFEVEFVVQFLLGNLRKKALTNYGGLLAHVAERTGYWLGNIEVEIVIVETCKIFVKP